MYEPFLKYPKGHLKEGQFIGKAHINFQKHVITFPSGSKSTFTYLEYDKHADAWYGSELSRVYFDEAQQQSEYAFDVIRSRLRSKAKMKSAMRLTLNPSSTSFVFEYVKPYLDEEGFPIKEYGGKIRYFLIVQGVLHSSWDRQELINLFPDKKPKTYTYIPSTIEDNKILQELEPDYKDSLDSLPEAKRKQLLLGCWYQTQNSCMWFNREHLKPLNRPPTGAVRCRAWDLAGTEYDPQAPKSSYASDPDYTVGTLMAKYKESETGYVYNYLIEDVVRERFSAAKVEELIFKTAERDRELYGEVIIYLPTDPNPSAASYIKGLRSKLSEKGFRTVTTKTNKAKVDRFLPFSIATENGFVQYVEAPWNKFYFQELEAFTGDVKEDRKRHDDCIDSTSDAYTTLNEGKNHRPIPIPQINSPTRLVEYRK